MPSALVSGLGQRRELSEFKTVLNDARNHVMHPVDAETMAQELVRSGGRELVEIVKELTAALVNAERELAEANRRYERLVADLKGRGAAAEGGGRLPPQSEGPRGMLPPQPSSGGAKPPAGEESAEWEEWDKRFRALLG